VKTEVEGLEKMFPEEYRSTILSLAEANEDVKTLLGIFYLLEGYTAEEALVKNFRAMTGKDCKDLLKMLRKNGIIKIGAYNEYLCLSGYEEVFNEIAAGFSPQPGDLSEYFEKTVEEGDKAALKMIESLLKMDIHGIGEFTQYDLIKNDMSEMFSPAVFHSLEEEFIKENLCVYGKRHRREFLKLYQSEDKIGAAKETVREWRAKKLAAMPVTKMLEKGMEELVKAAKKGAKEREAQFAEWSQFSQEELDKVEGYFSGFTMDDNFLFLTGDMLVGNDTLHLVVTDSISRYDVREWRDHPVVFITEEIPRWIRKIEVVFRGAYPELSERKVSIAVPNKVAYSNFKQGLLFELVNRLGIREVLEL
jgi:hypothetical protein